MRTSFDVDNSKTKKKRENKVLEFFSRHIILSGILVGLFVFVCILAYLNNQRIEQERRALAQKEAYKQQMFSESHTKLKYYMDTNEDGMAVQASSILIAHVMETGCSIAYSELQEVFDQNSLDYLADYLRGRSCGDYSSPPVVSLEKSARYEKFLVRLGSNNKRYVVTIKHDDNGNPTHFIIEKYLEKDMIKEESANEGK